MPRRRSIPACAGKTVDAQWRTTVHAVDSRVRGEGAPPPPPPRLWPGRSPRARGRLQERHLQVGQGRSIPACAGKTERGNWGAPPKAVDPRVRGEDWARATHGVTLCGRSPRARGRPRTRGAPTNGGRSIPACAGKTATVRARGVPLGVDPRVRGEDCEKRAQDALEEGRSPRARGRPPTSAGSRTDRRSIPACAGKTTARCAGTWRSGVDPRVRGEDAVTTPLVTLHGGRSPRARGRHSRERMRAHVERSIPACAGKTSGASWCSPCKPVDPRVRGED